MAAEYQQKQAPRSNAPESRVIEAIVFSPSVVNAEKRLRKTYSEEPDSTVASWDWTEILLSLHQEDYAPDSYKRFLSEAPPPDSVSFIRRSIDEWKDGVMRMINPDILQTGTPFEIHGKLFILCLSELDPALKTYLSAGKLLDEIRAGTTPDFETLISSTPDQRVILDDGPEFQDTLGRNSFARAMCTWLDNNWTERPARISSYSDTKSFVLHIGGPWGSGKSTLLNLMEKGFLCKEKKTADKLGEEVLQLEGDWITIWFSAWRNQYTDPAWWPLMNRIILDATRTLSTQYHRYGKYLRISVRENLWRFFTGKIWYFIAFLISLGFLILLLNWSVRGPGLISGNTALERYEGIMKTVASVLGLFGTVWTGVMVFSKSLVSGSSSSARNFIQQTNDPLEKIKKHFKRFIHSFEKNNHPILVFIDDLDRCNPGFVVNLLEGIQTIFTHRNLFFIVAADRRWLYTSFEKQYESFRENIVETGKSLGYLFLEKAIQASVTVPRLDNVYKQRYMDSLYKYGQADLKQKLFEKKKSFIDTVNQMTDDRQLTELLNANRGDPMAEQALRELAIERSAAKAMAKTTEYFLRQFTDLLEPNPRAMKRFINAYNIYKTLAYTIDDTLIDSTVKKKQFALWTILSIRWPLLAELLEQDPQKIGEFMKDDADIADSRWLPFIGNHQIKSVVAGEGIDVRLDADSIRKLCRINPIVHNVMVNYKEK